MKDSIQPPMFQAVILAGGSGTRLYPIAEVETKALLPVAHHPTVYFQLKLLEKYGFKDVIVVTNTKHYERMNSYLLERYKGSLQIDLVGVDEEMETANILRHIEDKIKTDFMVLSGDLVTDVMIHHVADTHRLNDAFVTAMLYPSVSPSASASSATPAKPDKADLGLIDMIGLDDKRTRLLYLTSAADVEEELTLPKRMMRKHPNMTITNKLRDAHFYIFSAAVFGVLAAKKNITSIKGELIPYLIRKQFSRSGIRGDEGGRSETAADPMPISGSKILGISPHDTDADGNDSIRCVAYVHDTGMCFRINSLSTYREACFQVGLGQISSFTPWEAPPKNPEQYVKQVSADSLVGESCVIGERVSVKRSIIGRHCNIGCNVKIANSIIMDHVVIQDGATIANCVICSHVRVLEKLTLKDCTVGDSRTVTHDAKNDTLIREDD